MVAAADQPAHPPAARDFELVLICTGNRVRSPVAEGFLRALLADLPVRVSSVGTLDLGAVPPLPEAIETAAALGLDISMHRARCVRAHDLSDADLVVGFERHHVAAAVVEARAPRERTFTILELAALLEQIDGPAGADPVERARVAVVRAHAARSTDSTLEELADPLGGSAGVYRDTISQVRTLCERVAAGLFGTEAVRPLAAVSADRQETPPRRRTMLRMTRDKR